MTRVRAWWVLAGWLILLGGGCRSPRAPAAVEPPVADEAWQRASRLGGQAYRSGDWVRAREHYRAALDIGRAAADAAATGLAAYHLAAADAALGDMDRAAAGLEEAEYELARAGMALGGVRLLRARLALAGGDAPAARAEAASLADDPSQAPAIRASATLLLARCARSQGDVEAALAMAEQAEDEALRIGAVEGAADAAVLAGEILHGLGRPAEAANRWAVAADHYRTGGRHRAMAKALGEAARAWHDAADPERAMAAAYQAGRSLAALNDADSASPWLRTGLQWAQQAGAQDWAARFRAALAESTP